jgi:hypothetical protein
MVRYKVKITIDDVNFVEVNESNIDDIKRKLEDNITKTFLLRIVNGIGEIKIDFNKK